MFLINSSVGSFAEAPTSSDVRYLAFKRTIIHVTYLRKNLYWFIKKDFSTLTSIRMQARTHVQVITLARFNLVSTLLAECTSTIPLQRRGGRPYPEVTVAVLPSSLAKVLS